MYDFLNRKKEIKKSYPQRPNRPTINKGDTGARFSPDANFLEVEDESPD